MSKGILNTQEKIDEGTYKWVIDKYIKGAEAVKGDYEYKRKCIYNNYFSLDFSELFIYMFSSSSSRFDFQLINYIFTAKHRDLKFTLLPPAIYELRSSYDYLQEKSKKSFIIEKSDKNRIFVDLLQSFKNYKNANNNNKKYLKTDFFKKYNLFVSENNDFSVIAKMGTVYGSTKLVDRSYKRFIDLYNKKIIINPCEVDFLKNNIKNIGIQQKVLDNVYDYLKVKRPDKDTPNFVDAEHAAMDYYINKNYCENSFMNIFTGSKYPYDAFEANLLLKHQTISPKKLFLARCPVYITLRTFCRNELEKKEYYNSFDFIIGIIELLKDLRDLPLTEEEQTRIITTKYKNVKNINEIVKIINSNIFFMNDPLNSYLDNSFKFSMSYNQALDNIKKELLGGGREEIRSSEIEILMKNLEISVEQGDFEKNLETSNNLVYENSLKLYDIYIDILEAFDVDKLSRAMRKNYEKIKMEPKEDLSGKDKK